MRNKLNKRGVTTHLQRDPRDAPEPCRWSPFPFSVVHDAARLADLLLEGWRDAGPLGRYQLAFDIMKMKHLPPGSVARKCCFIADTRSLRHFMKSSASTLAHTTSTNLEKAHS